MKSRIKGFLVMVMMILLAFPTYAANSKISIEGVSVQVAGTIKAGDINVTTDTPNCNISSFNVSQDRNTIEIYIAVDDGYWFTLTKASQVSVEGASYVTARKLQRSTMIRLIASQDDGGEWKSDDNGRYYQRPDGTLARNGWNVIKKVLDDHVSFRYYYFGEDGYLKTSYTTPDGYWVNENGEYTKVITQPNYGTDTDDAPQ